MKPSPPAHRLLPLALLFACGGTGTSDSASVADSHPQTYSPAHLSLLDKVITRSIEKGETPGAVALVWHRGEVIYRKAHGDRALEPEKQRMTVDTVFDMASLTKVMATAPAVMMLVEEGKIALTDRVKDYLPGFEQHEKGDIQVRHLLTHHSGLRPDIDLDEPWEGYDEAIERGLAERPRKPPGVEFIYSDINYFLLAEIVSRVSGQVFDVFCEERIFEPLGMNDTLFLPPAPLRERIAPTERRDGRMLRGEVHDPTTYRMGGVAGHAGLFSTADDTARFARMILNGGELDGRRVLSPLSVRAMTRPQTPPGLTELRGYGFDINSRFSSNRGDLFPVGSFGHTGFTGTSLWIDPLTQTFVILMTSRLHPEGKGSVVSLRKKVASVVAASLRDIPSPAQEAAYGWK